jgi:hypothetical protein
MISERQLGVLLALAAGVWALFLMQQHTPIGFQYLKPLPDVVTVVAALLVIFNKWAWRWWGIRQFITRPDLNGTWKGTVVSVWKRPGDSQAMPPIEAYFAIRQTYTTLDIRLFTSESSSELIADSIVEDTAGIHVVGGLFRNTPTLLNRHRSPMHHGAVLLNVRGNPPHALEGEYWTDRNTKGELRFEQHSKHIHYDFVSARDEEYRHLRGEQ